MSGVASQELPTVVDVERKLVVATALTQLEIARDAFATGLIQPQMLGWYEEVGYDDFHFAGLTKGGIVGVKRSDVARGSFVAGINLPHRRTRGNQGYEIDGTGEAFVFRIGDAISLDNLARAYTPSNGDEKQKYLGSRVAEISVEQYRSGQLPGVHVDIFAKLAAGTFAYVKRRLT